MKNFILIISLTFGFNCFSQTNSKLEVSFLLHFLEERILVIETKSDKQKMFSPEKISISIDTLGYYGSDFIFCKFKIGKNSIKATDTKVEIYFNSSSCTEYVLAFNSIDNSSYRLKGFNGNDLFFLLKDIKRESINRNFIKQVLHELNDLNLGIDFHKIYTALKRMDFDSNLLKTCINPKEAHGKIRR